jgi:hypothetical protein
MKKIAIFILLLMLPILAIADDTECDLKSAKSQFFPETLELSKQIARSSSQNTQDIAA